MRIRARAPERYPIWPNVVNVGSDECCRRRAMLLAIKSLPALVPDLNRVVNVLHFSEPRKSSGR
jgi:hypothetical protein